MQFAFLSNIPTDNFHKKARNTKPHPQDLSPVYSEHRQSTIRGEGKVDEVEKNDWSNVHKGYFIVILLTFDKQYKRSNTNFGKVDGSIMKVRNTACNIFL